MSLEYAIIYRAENNYENWVHTAYWQFLIIPQENSTQEFISVGFTNSLNVPNEYSINGNGFKTIRVHPRQKFKSISFEATFKLLKKDVNPFGNELEQDIPASYKALEELNFIVDFEAYLYETQFTKLPKELRQLFVFDTTKSIFENLNNLNHWTFEHLYFKTDVTDVNTLLEEIVEQRHGVCQDFTHLFCALARENGIPTRYVSGYLHQGNGYFGDSQMHAWAEAYVINVGWVGYDPTNDLLAGSNHIKVAHGRDYSECSPLKGVVYTKGTNKTSHSVNVTGHEQ